MPESRTLPPVLHRSRLLANGTTLDEIRTALRRQEWQAIHRGTYCTTGAFAALSEVEKHRVRALALADRSPHLVLSHVSAAALLRLPLWDARLTTVHLTRPGRGGSRTGPGRIVHASRLEAADVIALAGVSMTAVARTLVDLGCTTSMATAVVAADAALQQRLVTPADLAQALTAAGHRRGAAGARRALTFADGRSESAGESRTRMTLHQAGLPTPTRQIRIYGVDGVLVGRVDLGYPELGVLIEFDGLVKYQRPLRPGQRAEDVVIAEKLREDKLRALGYVVVRFVWADLADTAAMAARMTAALELGGRVASTAGLRGTWTADPALQIAG